MTEFTRAHTTEVKGAAILLMLMHHLWVFPERITGGAVLSDAGAGKLFAGAADNIEMEGPCTGWKSKLLEYSR